MAVLPKQSAEALPECYRHLLRDSNSEVIDMYPSNFKLDINGAAFAWMGVNLLPYIDMERLLKAMRRADCDGQKLNASEKERNKVTGDIYAFFVQNENSTSTLLKHAL